MSSYKVKDNLVNYNPIPDYRSIRELNFPRIPEELLENLSKNPTDYKSDWDSDNIDVYAGTGKLTAKFSDSFTDEINAWCKKNICNSIKWEWQLIYNDLSIHRDFDVDNLDDALVHTKFFYLVETGGSAVKTHFYNELDTSTLAETYILEPHVWYMFNAYQPHSVEGMEPGKVRYTIIGNVF